MGCTLHLALIKDALVYRGSHDLDEPSKLAGPMTRSSVIDVDRAGERFDGRTATTQTRQGGGVMQNVQQIACRAGESALETV